MSVSRWDVERYEAGHSYVWKMGESVIADLAPRAGEIIVDLGCGAGPLAAKIAEAGARVIGIDKSPEMIAQARINYPRIEFQLADACSFRVDPPADAVFSNAALHWVKDQDAALRSVARALKPGGRFVAELGGHGNISAVLGSLEAVLGGVAEKSPWYFPGIAEYAGLLERNGLEPVRLILFDRPTPVEDGMEDWLAMFAGVFFSGMANAEAVQRRAEVSNRLRPSLYRDGQWVLDYRRLRVIARRAA